MPKKQNEITSFLQCRRECATRYRNNFYKSDTNYILLQVNLTGFKQKIRGRNTRQIVRKKRQRFTTDFKRSTKNTLHETIN